MLVHGLKKTQFSYKEDIQICTNHRMKMSSKASGL